MIRSSLSIDLLDRRLNHIVKWIGDNKRPWCSKVGPALSKASPGREKARPGHSKAGPWQEKAGPGRREEGPRRGKAVPRRTPFQRTSMKQGLGAEKQGSCAVRQGTFAKQVQKWGDGKVFGPHRRERSAFLVENGQAWLRRSKAGSRRSKPLHFTDKG